MQEENNSEESSREVQGGRLREDKPETEANDLKNESVFAASQALEFSDEEIKELEDLEPSYLEAGERQGWLSRFIFELLDPQITTRRMPTFSKKKIDGFRCITYRTAFKVRREVTFWAFAVDASNRVVGRYILPYEVLKAVPNKANAQLGFISVDKDYLDRGIGGLLTGTVDFLLRYDSGRYGLQIWRKPQIAAKVEKDKEKIEHLLEGISSGIEYQPGSEKSMIRGEPKDAAVELIKGSRAKVFYPSTVGKAENEVLDLIRVNVPD